MIGKLRPVKISYIEKNPKTDIIDMILTLASYTYGPLIGLFAFGIFTKRNALNIAVPFICIIIPAICYITDKHSINWLNGYKFGYEMLIINGLLTFLALYVSSFLTNKPSLNHEN